MKVIFLQDVKGQGKKDEIKEVSDGYVRNYLLPNNLVKLATANTVKTLKTKIQTAVEETALAKSEVNLIKRKIEEVVLNFKLQVTDGKAFGSITDAAIVERLAAQYKIEIDKRKIKNHEPIHKLGMFYVDIKLDFSIEARLKVEVTEA